MLSKEKNVLEMRIYKTEYQDKASKSKPKN